MPLEGRSPKEWRPVGSIELSTTHNLRQSLFHERNVQLIINKKNSSALQKHQRRVKSTNEEDALDGAAPIG